MESFEKVYCYKTYTSSVILGSDQKIIANKGEWYDVIYIGKDYYIINCSCHNTYLNNNNFKDVFYTRQEYRESILNKLV